MTKHGMGALTGPSAIDQCGYSPNWRPVTSKQALVLILENCDENGQCVTQAIRMGGQPFAIDYMREKGGAPFLCYRHARNAMDGGLGDWQDSGRGQWLIPV